MRAMSETLMEQARRALHEERNDDAQAILINVIVREPEQDEAWLLLAEALADPGKKRECLERARAINPRNRAILRALERLNEVAPPPSEPPAPPAPPAPVETVAAPAAVAPVEPSASPDSADPLQSLLDYGEQIAQTVLLTLETPDTQLVGGELLKTLDQAATHDPSQTRRWVRSVGRSALIKYEKALTASIANLPRDDPLLPALREQRQRALNYLR
jgi:hypothetical protein